MRTTHILVAKKILAKNILTWAELKNSTHPPTFDLIRPIDRIKLKYTGLPNKNPNTMLI